MLCWFSKVEECCSPSRFMTSPATGSWGCFYHQAWFTTCWAGLKSNQTAVGYLQDTSITSLGKPCNVAWSSWGSQASQLGSSVGFFPPLEMYAVPSGAVTASPQEGGFQVRTGSGLLCHRLHFTFLFSLGGGRWRRPLGWHSPSCLFYLHWVCFY